MSNILQFQQKLNYTASDFQVRVSVSEKEFTDYWIYTAEFYIKTTARDLTPTTEEKIGELVVNSEETSKTQTFTTNFNHSSGKQITVICQGSLKTNGDGSVAIQSVNYEQLFDGHLTANSFIITPHINDKGFDEGEHYYSYSATVTIKPELDSFFMTKIVNTSDFPSSEYGEYGHVEYSTSVTFKTKKSEEITIYFTLNGDGQGSCSATVNGISPQWIDAPGRPKLLKYGNKLIKY